MLNMTLSKIQEDFFVETDKVNPKTYTEMQKTQVVPNIFWKRAVTIHNTRAQDLLIKQCCILMHKDKRMGQNTIQK